MSDSTGTLEEYDYLGSGTVVRRAHPQSAVDVTGDETARVDHRLYIIQDANFNIVAMVNTSGNVVERYAYDPFGVRTVMDASWNVIGSSAYAFEYGFQGMAYDAVSRSYKSRERTDYWPTLGVWGMPDPSGLEPDVNRYRFVGNNPIGYTDPSGLDRIKQSGTSASSIREIRVAVSRLFSDHGINQGGLSHGEEVYRAAVG